MLKARKYISDSTELRYLPVVSIWCCMASTFSPQLCSPTPLHHPDASEYHPVVSLQFQGVINCSVKEEYNVSLSFLAPLTTPAMDTASQCVEMSWAHILLLPISQSSSIVCVLLLLPGTSALLPATSTGPVEVLNITMC